MGFLYTMNTSRASSWLSRSHRVIRAYAEQNVTGSVRRPPLHPYIACTICVRSLIISITPPHRHGVKNTLSSLLCGIGHGDGLNKENRLAKPTTVRTIYRPSARIVGFDPPPPEPHPLNQSTRFHNDDQPLLLTDCSALVRVQQTYQPSSFCTLT